MRTYKNLYPALYDFDSLYDSYKRAIRNAAPCRSTMLYTYHLEENLINLQNHLIYRSYQPGPVHEFYIHDPKLRQIAAPAFPDRIIHWQIYKTIYPLFARGYIGDTYGSIEGGGTKKAVLRLMYFMRLMRAKYGKFYVLKTDISKFFFRIPHNVAMNELSSKIRDNDLLDLFEKYINQPYAYGVPLDADNIITCEKQLDVGFAPGSLFTQTIANIVLNPVDQYVKRDLHQHTYERYMDDGFDMGTKADLQAVEERLQEAYAERGLCLNKKTSIVPGNQGIEALGYIVTPDSIRLRRSTAVRMRRKLKENKADYEAGKITHEKARSVFDSYMGLLKIVTGDKLENDMREQYGIPRAKRREPETLLELLES